ncbi:MAG: bifunctional serine/threonine-protein kinase/formylglycine-generating enzyme family protein [Candidatus Hydrogenedentes bacterium]|nr:bifunctional serine/threonine-protein kinase/formylglycine-generating enzyme family protein [Candidatus Hydrogenedentota bacterium]
MLKRGEVVANRYVVKDIIGRGGMGRIYKVFDKALGEEVAMKTLLPKHVKDKVAMDRFFNEARIARALSHPNIIRVHDIGGTQSMVYISMEYLEGQSLRQLLDGLRPGQHLPINGILRMFDALCAALDYAHEYTVHRDIKPENVMILPDGSVRLMDFGISKLMSNPNLTSDSVVMGTPRYMSPEQLQNTANVDARADLYSLGVMLYEVITGIRPSALGKAASETRREVPPALDTIIEKCVDPDPSKRFQTAGELREALRKIRVAVETGSPVDEEGRVAPSGRESRRTATVVAGTTLVLAIFAAAAFGIVEAEARRHGLLGEAAVATPGIGESAALDFDAARTLVDRARTHALEAIDEYPEKDRNGILKQVMESGEELWREAVGLSESEPARALELAADALSCFIAPIVWPEGMVFVPPGPVVLEGPSEEGISEELAGFFIDSAEVSMPEFAEFCERGPGWRWPMSAGGFATDIPMTHVTYYDALAFAASQRPPKRLPSEAQWARAIRVFLDLSALAPTGEGPGGESLDERGEDRAEEENPLEFSRHAAGILYVSRAPYFEWTSSPWTDLAGERYAAAHVGFGSPVVIRGGAFDAFGNLRAIERRSMMYESKHRFVTFRGVMALPETLDGLARWVR